MSLLEEYREARRAEGVARIRRALALRALAAEGTPQREIALALGVSQPAVSQQLRASEALLDVHPERLVEAGGDVLKQVAESRGFTRLAVFGSVARGDARLDSDIDVLVQAPEGAGIRELIELQEIFAEILGRRVDVVTYGGLKPRLDDDIRREAVPL